jgi:hypothetical protein
LPSPCALSSEDAAGQRDDALRVGFDDFTSVLDEVPAAVAALVAGS